MKTAAPGDLPDDRIDAMRSRVMYQVDTDIARRGRRLRRAVTGGVGALALATVLGLTLPALNPGGSGPDAVTSMQADGGSSAALPEPAPAEMDGLDASSNILLIAATNRLDLCDEALVRHGRLGNAIHQIPRPGRAGTEAILLKHLGERVPLDKDTTIRGLADAASGFLFAERGAGVLATVTYATATKHEVRARDVVSGALIAGAVRRAIFHSRRTRGDGHAGAAARTSRAARHLRCRSARTAHRVIARRR